MKSPPSFVRGPFSPITTGTAISATAATPAYRNGSSAAPAVTERRRAGASHSRSGARSAAASIPAKATVAITSA